MDIRHKATRIRWFSFDTVPMRAFHMSWFAFFLCFFAWFGIAPLMAVVRDELHLTAAQVGNTIIASVAFTVLARLAVGWMCERFGPRLTYTWVLVLGSIPVMGIGLAQSYETFLLFRLAIGAIGASFVITQYHTSVMFAPNCVGTANATTAGWGNLGGGVTQMVMPLLFAALMALGAGTFWSWRLAMFIAGVVCLLTGIAYYRFTQDAPDGNFKALREAGKLPDAKQVNGSFLTACRDVRVWALFVAYGACFGIELTVLNIAAIYFMDYFGLGLAAAGIAAGLFGLMNLFARTLGGVLGDRAGLRWGLRWRVIWLAIALFGQGITLMLFSRMTELATAVAALLLFSLFVKMAAGATFSVVPFVNRQCLGSVAGIVGAGGNAGAVLAAFLFKGALAWPQALLILGGLVTVCSVVALAVRFSPADERAARQEMEDRLAEQEAFEAVGLPAFSE